MNNYFSALAFMFLGLIACQSVEEKKPANTSDKEQTENVVTGKSFGINTSNSDVNTKIEGKPVEIESKLEDKEAGVSNTDKKDEAPVTRVAEKEKAPSSSKKSSKTEVASKPKSKPKTKPKKEEKLPASLVTNTKTSSPKKKKEKTGPLPKLVFEYSTFDFGIVDYGDTVIHKFHFVNEGDAPAIISDASSSCGCTVPEYPKKPIKPGEKSFVKAVFNTQGRLDRQKKSITIKANTEPNYTTLYLVGDIYKRPEKKDVKVGAVDSTKLDSIKKAKKKAEKDSLKRIKKKAKKDIPEKKASTTKKSLKEIEDSLKQEIMKLEKDRKQQKGGKDQIDLFLKKSQEKLKENIEDDNKKP